VDDYLGKPFTEKRLLAVVQELIGRYQARVKQADETAQKIKGGAKNELPTENEWLEQLQQETFRSIAKETFSVDQLATAMLMGRTNFYNEVKRLTGLTPNQYVLEARLMKARHLLETRQELTIKAILREVGLRDERYFTKMFKQRFGQLPSYFR
jgi:AraC-like DNA-binding protein